MTTTHFEETMEGFAIGRVSRDHEFSMAESHIHDDYEIYYLIEGERYYFIDTRTFYCPPGSLVLIERNLVHKTSTVQTPYHDRILIELKGALLEPLMNQLGTDTKEYFHKYTGVYQLSYDQQQIIEKLLLMIADEIQSKKLDYEFSIKLKLMELFLFIIRFDGTQNSSGILKKAHTSKHDLVEKVATYLSTAYIQNESLDEISRKYFVNKCYLSRIFKEVTGFTISEYTNIQRIRKARTLLGETNISITVIAQMLGFKSSAYFVRVFKTYTLTTPHHYRKQIQSFFGNPENKDM